MSSKESREYGSGVPRSETRETSPSEWDTDRGHWDQFAVDATDSYDYPDGRVPMEDNQLDGTTDLDDASTAISYEAPQPFSHEQQTIDLTGFLAADRPVGGSDDLQNDRPSDSSSDLVTDRPADRPLEHDADQPPDSRSRFETTSESDRYRTVADEALRMADRTFRDLQKAFSEDSTQLAEHARRLADLPAGQASGNGTVAEELEATTDAQLAAELLERLFDTAAQTPPGTPTDDPLLITVNMQGWNRALKKNRKRFGGPWSLIGRAAQAKAPWLLSALVNKFRLREVSATGSLGVLGLAQGSITLIFEPLARQQDPPGTRSRPEDEEASTESSDHASDLGEVDH
jgi:hypothetical protein